MNVDFLELLRAAKNLREAQKAYMADRGNDELGRMVAQRAKQLDEVIKDIEQLQ